MLTHQAESYAEAVLALNTEFALATREARIQHHLVSGLQTADTLTHFLDDSGPIRSHHVRHLQIHSRNAFQNKEVEAVEGHGSGSNQDVAWVYLRTIDFLEVELIQGSMPVDDGGVHFSHYRLRLPLLP